MANELDYEASEEQLKKYADIYFDLLEKNRVTPHAKFHYAMSLVQSKDEKKINEGIAMLESLSKTDRRNKDEYIYYLAIGHTRLKNFYKALDLLLIVMGRYKHDLKFCNLFKAVKEKMEMHSLNQILASLELKKE
ncbi:mitochondrial fission 1 protein-like [Aethina tumida]|uniref:mitochondrial fission 1 protein-like n=1 Tax=Aethina tumida TaxID=116153 RepID=UPI00096B2444|nr:mitochondrial fission 1 protein-like [Aethina tumida]